MDKSKTYMYIIFVPWLSDWCGMLRPLLRCKFGPTLLALLVTSLNAVLLGVGKAIPADSIAMGFDVTGMAVGLVGMAFM